MESPGIWRHYHAAANQCTSTVVSGIASGGSRKMRKASRVDHALLARRCDGDQHAVHWELRDGICSWSASETRVVVLFARAVWTTRLDAVEFIFSCRTSKVLVASCSDTLSVPQFLSRM